MYCSGGNRDDWGGNNRFLFSVVTYFSAATALLLQRSVVVFVPFRLTPPSSSSRAVVAIDESSRKKKRRLNISRGLSIHRIFQRTQNLRPSSPASHRSRSEYSYFSSSRSVAAESPNFRPSSFPKSLERNESAMENQWRLGALGSHGRFAPGQKSTNV